MSLTEEDIRIKIKLEQDFPFNNITIKEYSNTKQRAIFFDGFNSGFSYSINNIQTLKEYGQVEYAEKVFYDQLRNIMINYFTAQEGR